MTTMPGITALLLNWWKQFLLVMILCLLAVGIITFLRPRQYLSVATAVPASSVGSDKSKIFSDNIEALYSALGNPDDLDLIVGTSRLDTLYLIVTDRFNLFDHYKINSKPEIARIKAAAILKKNTRVIKSEYGELKVKVWDTDKNLAPQLANEIMSSLQTIHTNLKNMSNLTALHGLQEGVKKLTTKNDSTDQNKEVSAPLLLQYEKLISEYQLMVDTKPQALYIVENANAGLKPDRPKRLQVMVATAILSFLFSLLAVLVLERKKIMQ